MREDSPMPNVAFPERLSGFLRRQLDGLRAQYGGDSAQYLGLARQYLRDPREDIEAPERNLKHYEAGVTEDGELGAPLPPGLERLYRRTLVIEPTFACLAHCRYCLRSNYPKHTLTEEQLIEVARYCGDDANRELLNEVLITGGDPLIVPHRVETLLQALAQYAPNIRIVRLGTRVPTQDPERIDDDVLRLFQDKPTMRFELATQVNHPTEFCDASLSAFQAVQALGVKVYSQNVLLKGVNDDLPTLLDLYSTMRNNDIEAHYLFHCIPLKGTHHLRTNLDRGIRLARELTSCGGISGRAKPMFAVMSDIGKITLYEGCILERRDGRLLLQSHYTLADRRAWNPSWQLPTSAEVGSDGFLRVWYVDGED